MARGSAGNVIAALASFFIPGLGQLVQARMGSAVGFGMAWGFLWLLALAGLGFLMAPLIFLLAVWATVDAAGWDPEAEAASAARTAPPGPPRPLTPDEKRDGRRAMLELALYTALGIGGTVVLLWWIAGRS